MYKTLYLKVLNQKLTFKIYDDTFYYYIETFLELPNFTEKERDWFKKQFDTYIFKLLREEKLTNSNTTDKISQNIDKNIKNNPIRTHFNKGYESFMYFIGANL